MFHLNADADVEGLRGVRREGTAEQVAEAVALLITNDYITGETIVIDGGLSMRIA